MITGVKNFRRRLILDSGRHRNFDISTLSIAIMDRQNRIKNATPLRLALAKRPPTPLRPRTFTLFD